MLLLFYPGAAQSQQPISLMVANHCVGRKIPTLGQRCAGLPLVGTGLQAPAHLSCTWMAFLAGEAAS